MVMPKNDGGKNISYQLLNPHCVLTKNKGKVLPSLLVGSELKPPFFSLRSFFLGSAGYSTYLTFFNQRIGNGLLQPLHTDLQL